MASALKFLQRIHFSPGAKPGRGDARPAIVQYHLQATSETAKRQGYVLANVEPWAVEHGASLAAGPAALDLLDRIVFAYDNTVPSSVAAATGLPRLIGEARALVERCEPPAGSVLPNGTARHALPDPNMVCAVCGSGMRCPAPKGTGGGEVCAKCGHDTFIPTK